MCHTLFTVSLEVLREPGGVVCACRHGTRQVRTMANGSTVNDRS